MTGTGQRFATRLNWLQVSHTGPASIGEAVRAVASVSGVSALELNYPQHFTGNGITSVLAEAIAEGPAITAINLCWNGPENGHAGFDHGLAKNRERAIAAACDAVDLAARNGIAHVILWLGPNGHEYPMEANFQALWELEIAGFRRVAARQPDVRVSVEYRPGDPRQSSPIRCMTDCLLAAQEVGLENFGVSLDFCHSLMAGEQPSVAAAQALQAGKLFGVHLNDGYGLAQDGLMVGVAHPWQTLELLAELRQGNYGGTICFETFPERADAARECAANVRTVGRMMALLERVPVADLRAAQAGQDAKRATQLIQDLIFGAVS